MIPIQAKVSGNFLSHIKQRQAKWAGLKRVAARIRVSEKLHWWYYQEFGVAGSKWTQKPDPLGQYPGTAAIWRKNAPAMVSLEQATGELHFFTKVKNFPGIRPRDMIRSVLPEIEATLQQRIHEALRSGGLDNPQVLIEVVEKATEEAKATITRSFGEKLRNTPSAIPGRQSEQTASQAFSEDAKVIQLSYYGKE